jgi:hypothetical protein
MRFIKGGKFVEGLGPMELLTSLYLFLRPTCLLSNVATFSHPRVFFLLH